MSLVQLPTQHPDFSPTYREARERFLAAARSHGATIASEIYPECAGPGGEELALDIALFGNLEAERWLVALSGTHGPEGFAGSAIQLNWINRFPSGVTAGVGVALLHGVNPWGFAYGQRTTQNNVDLNRNFVDPSLRTQPNDHIFEEISTVMAIEVPNEEAFAKFHEARDRLIEQHGLSVFGDAMVRGQYHDSNSICFGGSAPEWSNRALEKLLCTHLSKARKIGLIDWHTGLGEHGEPFFLIFNESQPLFDRAVSWWGEPVVRDAGGFDGAELPKYSGTVCQGVIGMLNAAEVVATVIEIGTYPFSDMSDALLVENWLRSPAGLAAPDRDQWTQWTVERFNPSNIDWQQNVVRHGGEIMSQALAGITVWD